MADSVRVQRVAEQIRGELSQILRDEIGDPRIGMVTITRVKLASDMGAATIFYCPLGEDPDEQRKTELKYAMSAGDQILSPRTREANEASTHAGAALPLR